MLFIYMYTDLASWARSHNILCIYKEQIIESNKGQMENKNIYFLLGGILGFGIGYYYNRQKISKNNVEGIHVLKVDLSFENEKERSIFCKNFKPLTKKVYAREPNCFSYKVMLNNGDDTKLSIFESYKSKADLDGIHHDCTYSHLHA